MLGDVRDLIEFAQHSGKPRMSGPLRVGVIPSVAPYLLPPLLPLCAEHPELELHVRETQTLPLMHELVEGKLDVLLLALPVTHPDVETLALFEDRFAGAAEVQVRPACARPRTSSSTSGCSCSRRPARPGARLLQPAAGELVNTFGASSLATIVEMVAAGYGITLLPDHLLPVEGRGRELALMPFAEPEPFAGLAWHNLAGAPISWTRAAHRAAPSQPRAPQSDPYRARRAASSLRP